MSNNIEGKVVIITGASSGLGEKTARHLAKLGASVALGARRKERLEAVVKDIQDAGGKAFGVVTDVTNHADVEALVQKSISHFGKIDVLVNNSGVMPIAPLALRKIDEWDRAIDTNIKGVLYGIAAVLPHFQQAKGGHIINIASVAGLKVFAPGGVVYSATKFAVRAITEGLRMETRKDNIRTTLISPGAVESELKHGSSDEASTKAVYDFYKMEIPADSVARAIAYAIEQPGDVEINEIVLRPTAQEF
jgi:NADP-dependent 3-hydroxy acid dehydrogenase YdfG